MRRKAVSSSVPGDRLAAGPALGVIPLSLIVVLSAVLPLRGAPVIRSRIDDGPWSTTSAVDVRRGQSIALRVDETAGATIRWYRITPDTHTNHSNSRRPRAGGNVGWAGHARIGYQREEIRAFRDRWEVLPLTAVARVGLGETMKNWLRRRLWRIGIAQVDFPDVGSFWFQVEVECEGRIERSPGIGESDHRGLSPGVLRVSVRESDDFIGYVTSYLNVPGLYGSTNYQSENYIGVDCADVLVAAHRRVRGQSTSRNYNVSHLVDLLTHVAEFDLRGGAPSVTLEWGADIRPGDLLAVRYTRKRQYGHIGALYSDVNRNGRLDRNDMMLHAGPAPLHYSPLKCGAFDGHVIVLRLGREL